MLEGPNYLTFTERLELLNQGIDYNILEETYYFSYYPASLMENPNTKKMLNLQEFRSIKHHLANKSCENSQDDV